MQAQTLHDCRLSLILSTLGSNKSCPPDLGQDFDDILTTGNFNRLYRLDYRIDFRVLGTGRFYLGYLFRTGTLGNNICNLVLSTHRVPNVKRLGIKIQADQSGGKVSANFGATQSTSGVFGILMNESVGDYYI